MARRFVLPIRANVGSSQAKIYPSSKEYTRVIRKQMQNIIKNLSAFNIHIGEVSTDILEEALQPVFEDSQILVPVATGSLKASGYLESRKFRNRMVTEIGYGRGGKPHYAAQVHENKEVIHKAPTTAKFLQYPLSYFADEIQETIIKGYTEASRV